MEAACVQVCTRKGAIEGIASPDRARPGQVAEPGVGDDHDIGVRRAVNVAMTPLGLGREHPPQPLGLA